MPDTLSIGQLAKRTGLTVRTLHHYDAVGLLRPSARTAAGHRRYGPADVARLQQIASLRAVGLGLGAIAAVLDDPEADALAVVERHAARLRARIAQETRLCEQLEGIAAYVRARGHAPLDALLSIIQLTTMIEKHYTPEQLDALAQRREAVGEDRIREVQQAWADLFAEVDRHREAGTDPADPALGPLAERAEALIAAFTGGDAGIRQSLDNAVRADTASMYEAWGVSPDLGAYYGRVMAAHAAK